MSEGTGETKPEEMGIGHSDNGNSFNLQNCSGEIIRPPGT